MTMRAKNRNDTKINKVLQDYEVRQIEIDPNSYDAILWPVVMLATKKPDPSSYYEDDYPIVLDEIENEQELGDPELIVMVDLPIKTSHLILDVSSSDLTGGNNEPIAVKINRRNVPVGSAIMFNFINSKQVAISATYTVDTVGSTDNQGFSHMYYLMPFTGDETVLSKYT